MARASETAATGGLVGVLGVGAAAPAAAARPGAGRCVTFDSIHAGTRQIYAVDVSAIVGGANG